MCFLILWGSSGHGSHNLGLPKTETRAYANHVRRRHPKWHTHTHTSHKYALATMFTVPPHATPTSSPYPTLSGLIRTNRRWSEQYLQMGGDLVVSFLDVHTRGLGFRVYNSWVVSLTEEKLWILSCCFLTPSASLINYLSTWSEHVHHEHLSYLFIEPV